MKLSRLFMTGIVLLMILGLVINLVERNWITAASFAYWGIPCYILRSCIGMRRKTQRFQIWIHFGGRLYGPYRDASRKRLTP